MQALRLSLEIGAAMMESGGEVRRTEDTVTRINYAAGATDAQVWAVPGILTATVILADNTTHTGTKRLGPEEIDLAELDRLNTLVPPPVQGRDGRLDSHQTPDIQQAHPTAMHLFGHCRLLHLLWRYLGEAVLVRRIWHFSVRLSTGTAVRLYSRAAGRHGSRATGVYAAGTGTAPAGRQHTHWHHYVAGARADGGQRATRYD